MFQELSKKIDAAVVVVWDELPNKESDSGETTPPAPVPHHRNLSHPTSDQRPAIALTCRKHFLSASHNPSETGTVQQFPLPLLMTVALLPLNKVMAELPGASVL